MSFNQAQTGELTLIIEQTVFTETIFVLSKFYEVPREKISEILSSLLSYKDIYNEDMNTLLTTLELFAKNNLHIVDCLLFAKSKTTGFPILSFDKQLNNLLDQDTDS